ncbi:MAG: hypothetical protein SGPRY_008946 [Prymnesium sp.]
MEWLPYGAARVESLSAGMSKLGPVAMEQLRAVYKQLGGEEENGVSVAHVWDLWRSMDLAVDQPSEQQRLQIAMAAARVEASEAATVSFEQLCQLMHPTTLQPELRACASPCTRGEMPHSASAVTPPPSRCICSTPMVVRFYPDASAKP